MAKIYSGILGGFSGKVGSVIGYVMGGIAYMRGLASSYTDANTLAQQDQRAKFSLVISFLRPFVSLVRVSYQDASTRMSGFASAVSFLLKNCITGASPAFALDYAKILLGRGPIPVALNAEVTSVAPGTVDFTWDNNSWDYGAKELDKVVLGIFDPVLKKAVTVVGAGTRATGNQSVVLPALFEGNQVQCWIGFEGENDFSNIEWCGAVNVAA